jgi:putative flippase GtrA
MLPRTPSILVVLGVWRPAGLPRIREPAVTANERLPFVRIAVDLYRRFAQLAHELAKFGVIGVLNFVVTIGISDTLHLGLGMGPLTSFGVGTVVATTISYFANRYWTFRHRDTSGLGREYVLFFILNGIALLITWVFIAITHYILGLHDGIAYNAAEVVGTGAATMFRYWAYKKWVFLAVVPPADPLPAEAPEKVSS